MLHGNPAISSAHPETDTPVGVGGWGRGERGVTISTLTESSNQAAECTQNDVHSDVEAEAKEERGRKYNTKKSKPHLQGRTGTLRLTLFDLHVRNKCSIIVGTSVGGAGQGEQKQHLRKKGVHD